MRKTILLVITVVILFSLASCKKESDDAIFLPSANMPNLATGIPIYIGSGNTVGNIVNSGIVAESDGWIYYHNPSVAGHLYKMRVDGSDRTKLNEDESYYINVYRDWVYYCNGSDNGSLYKIRLDGSERTKLNDGECAFLNVVVTGRGIDAYYANGKDDNLIYIQSSDSNGIMPTDYNTELAADADGRFINVVGDWIYYYHDESALYKIRTDGTERTRLRDGEFLFMNVVDDWVYYSNVRDNCNLYKMNIDGTGMTKLNDDASFWINASGDWIFYSNDSDRGSLYKIRTDGSEKTKLNDYNTTGISIVSEWIFFINADDNCLYRIRTDGTGHQLVE